MTRTFFARTASLVLIVCLLLPLWTLPAQAESPNLLNNPGFENGKTGWSNDATCTLVTDAHSGSYAMQATKTTNNWFSLLQNPLPVMQNYGNGIYSASCWMKGTPGAVVQLTLKLIGTNNSAIYLQAPSVSLTSAYQKAEFTFTILLTSYTRIEYYWYTTTPGAVTLCVDDCSLVFLKTVEESALTSPDETIVRPEHTLVGAIRWDAYYATSPSPSEYSVSDQVARTLSYYKDQAPYFTRVRTPASGDVLLKFSSAYVLYGTRYRFDNVASPTLEPTTFNYAYGTTWESEARYAVNAGLDYFAYLWYKSDNKMALPRKAHVALNGYLPDGRQLKMCGILERGHFGEPADLADKTTAQKLSAISVDHKELYQAMAQDSYLCVTSSAGLSAVLYCYNALNSFNEPDVIAKIREEAIFYTAYLAAQKPEKYRAVQDVYFVAMVGTSVNYDAELALRLDGFSALSRYSESITPNASNDDYREEVMTRYEYNDLALENGTEGTAKSVSYARLSDANYDANNRYAGLAQRISCIPLATAGRAQVPRVKTGVKWTNDYGWMYCRRGTAAEIAANVSRNLQWIDAHPDATPANMMLIYAWNEHDEGGWLCPTLKTDANGNILKDSGGTPLIDSSILDAVSTVLWAHKGETLVTGDLNGDGEVNAIDRALLARTLADWSLEEYVVLLQCGDVNRDGDVNELDRVILSRYLAQWGSAYSQYFDA